MSATKVRRMAISEETGKACERIAAAMANMLWGLSTETLAAMVDYEHEPDEVGEHAAHESLWDAVYSKCLTTAVANHDHDIPFLQRPPDDKGNAKGVW